MAASSGARPARVRVLGVLVLLLLLGGALPAVSVASLTEAEAHHHSYKDDLLASAATDADPAQPATADNVRLVASRPGSTGGHVDITGDRLYLGTYGYGFRIFDITDPTSPEPIGEYIPGPQSQSDPGARADAVPTGFDVDDRRFAILNGTGRGPGTQQSEFLDVTDPENPELLWQFTGADNGEAHVGNIAHDRLWWLPTGGGGNNGLRIYDLRPLLEDEPGEPEVLFRGNPQMLWQESPHRGDRPPGPGFSHSHDLQVYTDHPVQVGEDPDGQPIFEPRDIVLMAEGGNYLGAGNTGSVYVIDVTDPANPVVLNRWRHEQDDPGAHPIRYYHEVQFLDGDPSVMVLADEDLHSGCDAGRFYTVQVSDDLTEATKLGEWAIGSGQGDAPVCAGSHVFTTDGHHVHMGAYVAGYQVIDVSDPENPVRAGRYIAPGANSWGAVFHEGFAFVGDMGGRGLDVFEFIPDAVAEGTVAPNPATQQVSGFNENLCEQLGIDDAPTVDALMVHIPEEAADGQHQFRATGNGPLPYNLKVYFYDEACQFMAGMSLNWDDPDMEGPIPEGAGYAAVTNAVGAPTYVYAQILN